MANKLRIHGDNILECENALKLLASAFNNPQSGMKLINGPAYAPVYRIGSDVKEEFDIQLFPGYKRWGFNLEQYIMSLGAPLREMPDAIITRIEEKDGALYETPELALEFSGALPAGNNAWQRTGRALALAYAGIPYLYFAELGGQELDSERVVKAARFPNPLVPFAYAALGMGVNTLTMPIYLRSSSIHQNIVEIFKDCFGNTESIQLIRGVLLKEDYSSSKTAIEKKTAKILEVLSQNRKRADILNSKEWVELFTQKTGLEKIEWLVKKAMPWNKKTGVKTLTPTFVKLLKLAIKVGAVAIGSKEMPICIIPQKSRLAFSQGIKKLYKNKATPDFLNWLEDSKRSLVCVWINGFKPRGDDSRPDRGLVPLARMIFGFEKIDVLTMVYGPAKPFAWKQLHEDMSKLAQSNGLWEAIINLSDAILVDSSTSKKLSRLTFLIKREKQSLKKDLLPLVQPKPNFGEHDVDSVLHLLFSKANSQGVYESLCNPPGGDWSGISIIDFEKKIEYRWTSLPRVSGVTSKRPDHIIQFSFNKSLLAIESKDIQARLEDGIGPRLDKYVQDLIGKAPTAFRDNSNEHWDEYKLKVLGDRLSIFSAAAFRFINESELKISLNRGRVDIVLGVELNTDSQTTVIHVLANKKASRFIPVIQQLASRFKDILDVKVHN